MGSWDIDKIDDVTLALLLLTRHNGDRTWKGYDRDVLNRLYEKGFITDPKTKTKSVCFTVEGLERSEKLFNRLFAKIE